jgi:hypothetical protein
MNVDLYLFKIISVKAVRYGWKECEPVLFTVK